MKRIALIGAGWAGLSAALTLQRRGHKVTLYERSPAKGDDYQGAGGRASTAYAVGERAPFAIDNGQHVMLGAYRDTLALFASLRIDAEQAFLRVPASWFVPNHLDIAIAPWADSSKAQSLWNAGVFKQLPMALALFKTASFFDWPALALAAIRLQCSDPKPNTTVAQWLMQLKFPAVFNEQLWQPLCLATLNTPPNTASATVFKRVIQDGLLAGSQAAAMLVPRQDLGRLFPSVALRELLSNGAQLYSGSGVDRITADDRALTIHAKGEALVYDALICATSAKDAVRLLPANCVSAALAELATQAPEPITTIHLNLGKGLRLPKPVCVLPEPAVINTPIVHAVAIDRAYLSGAQAGWLTVVLSCSGAALGHDQETLINAALNRLKECFPALEWPENCTGVVIHAKQATFACTAGLERPAMRTNDARIVLAGDYVTGEYPATLEGAVRSGLNAADLIGA